MQILFLFVFNESLFVCSPFEFNSKLPGVVEKIHKVLKSGGVVLFRDYGIGDMAEERFKAKSESIVEEGLYARHDGTLAHYFSIGNEEMKEEFIDSKI